jgi:hypothetical protein
VTNDNPTWEDRYPDQVTCVRCLVVKERASLDRLLWCEECREIAQARAMEVGWWVGGAVAAALAAYIWLVVERSRALMGAWVGLTLAAFYLGGRMTRDLLYGVERMRNSRAREAVPPTMDPPSGETSKGPPLDDDGPPQVNLRG